MGRRQNIGNLTQRATIFFLNAEQVMYVRLALSHRSVPWDTMMPDYNTGQKKVSLTTEWSSPT